MNIADLIRSYLKNEILYPEALRYEYLFCQASDLSVFAPLEARVQKPQSDWTITFPAWNDAHLLSIALHGLVRHSTYRHRINIIWSDPAAFETEETKDSLGGDDRDVGRAFDPITLKPYVKYATVRDFFSQNAQWLADHDIYIFDITDACLDFRKRFLRGEISSRHPGQFIGWIDVAYKLNYGLSLLETEWALMLWEDDMYPSPGWDQRLMETASANNSKHAIYIPTQVYPMRTQSWGLPENPPYENIWEDFRHLNCNNIPWFYSQDEHNPRPCIATNEQWVSFCERHTRIGAQYDELAGMRARTSACPVLIKTEIAHRVGPYRYDWQTPELDFDDMCRDKERLSKVSPNSSFVSHKLVIAAHYDDI